MQSMQPTIEWLKNFVDDAECNMLMAYVS